MIDFSPQAQVMNIFASVNGQVRPAFYPEKASRLLKNVCNLISVPISDSLVLPFPAKRSFLLFKKFVHLNDDVKSDVLFSSRCLKSQVAPESCPDS